MLRTIWIFKYKFWWQPQCFDNKNIAECHNFQHCYLQSRHFFMMLNCKNAYSSKCIYFFCKMAIWLISLYIPNILLRITANTNVVCMCILYIASMGCARIILMVANVCIYECASTFLHWQVLQIVWNKVEYVLYLIQSVFVHVRSCPFKIQFD